MTSRNTNAVGRQEPPSDLPQGDAATGELYVGELAELKREGTWIRFYEEIRDEIILFFDADGKVVCFSSVCPHMAGEIQRGSGSAALRCRWHGLEFDGCGGSINGKGKLSLRRYPANVRGEKIFITYVR